MCLYTAHSLYSGEVTHQENTIQCDVGIFALDRVVDGHPLSVPNSLVIHVHHVKYLHNTYEY
jgi:hypothetical protein